MDINCGRLFLRHPELIRRGREKSNLGSSERPVQRITPLVGGAEALVRYTVKKTLANTAAESSVTVNQVPKSSIEWVVGELIAPAALIGNYLAHHSNYLKHR
jgi:hypothetical protein